MRFFLFLFFISAVCFDGQAANENLFDGKISGRIIDSSSNLPIEYATVGLFLQGDNKVVNGTTTDNRGVFKLNKIPKGTYKLSINFIGYATINKTNLILNSQYSNISFGDIKLSAKQNMLKEVTITKEKSIIENKIDKTVYNADKDITSQSGVAADVLKKVPQVSIDADGNVELQGNSNIRFLINGKPSALFGSNIADVLQSIPSNQIQSIEVITSPGAKYDAEGTGGIINIIMKRSTSQGFNGNLSLSVGTRLENGSFNLNIRKGKFGVNAFFGGNAQLNSTTVNRLNRKTIDLSGSSQLLQDGTGQFRRSGDQSGVGFDWDINDQNNITGTVGYNYFGNHNAGSAHRQTIMNDAVGNQLSDITDAINSRNYFHSQILDYSLNYKKKFKKKDQEFELSWISSNANNFSYYSQAQKELSSDAILNGTYGNNPGFQKETNIAANYTHPLRNGAMIEAGAKLQSDNINGTSDVYLMNEKSGNYDFNGSQSSVLNYKREIYAGYISASFKIFNFLDIKAGVRNEYTRSKANFTNYSNVSIAPYNTLIPSFDISYTLKNNQIIKVSYTHRLQRPEYRDLNPFVNSSDPKNITSGNPNLRPEVGNKVEFGYNKNFENGATINTTLFYRGNIDDIQSYTRYYPTFGLGDSTYTNVAVSTRQNIGREDNYGLNIFASIPAMKNLTLRTNISCFERYIFTGISSVADVHGFSYRTTVNASYQLNSTLILELFGNFNSKRINAQGSMPSFTTYNFAFRKQLFKNASIAVTATNFFNKYVNQRTNLKGDNFNSLNIRDLPYRSFGINFTYKFGRLKFKKEKEAEDINLTDPPGNEK